MASFQPLIVGARQRTDQFVHAALLEKSASRIFHDEKSLKGRMIIRLLLDSNPKI